MIFHSFLKISSFHFILLLAMPVTQKKQSCLFLSFLFPSLLLLTPKSVQLFGEETWKVAKLPTITPVPVWKKLLPSQSDSLSQVPHQLLTHNIRDQAALSFPEAVPTYGFSSMTERWLQSIPIKFFLGLKHVHCIFSPEPLSDLA